MLWDKLNSLIGFLFAMLYMVTFAYYHMYFDKVWMFFVCGICSCCAIFVLTGKNYHKSHHRLLYIVEYLGEHSLYIYIIHPVIEHGIRIFLIKADVYNLAFWIAALTLGGIMISVLYSYLCKKIWILDAPFRPRKVIRQLMENRKAMED